MSVGASLGLEHPRIEIGGAVDSARADEAASALLAAIKRIRDGDDFARRFAYARRRVLRRMLLIQGDPSRLAEELARSVKSGYGYSYYEELASKVATLKPQDVRDEVERTIDLARSVTLLEGPEVGVRRVLSGNELGPVKFLEEP